MKEYVVDNKAAFWGLGRACERCLERCAFSEPCWRGSRPTGSTDEANLWVFVNLKSFIAGRGIPDNTIRLLVSTNSELVKSSYSPYEW
jgi:hypothetical protein